jgi:hypothetical protein
MISAFSHVGAERSRRWPWVATGLCGLGLVLAVLFPTWLGQLEWWPDRGLDFEKPVAVGFEGDITPAGDWVDATRAEWLQDGLRVTLVEVRRGPVELIGGPKKQRKKTKEDVLQLVLTVSNDLAGRPVEFPGWEGQVALTDAQGRGVPVKKFESGWAPLGSSKGQRISVGLAAEVTLYFELPTAEGGGTGKLELPATTAGGTDPVRFRVPLTAYRREAQTGGRK